MNKENSSRSEKAPRSFQCKLNDIFHSFARATSQIAGSAWSFILAMIVIVAWATTGPVFHFSDTWQLIINTGTTIVTFLMVFLIQNTQNRDAKAAQLKLDELIHAVKKARNEMIDLEHLSDEEIEKLRKHFEQLGIQARNHKPVVENGPNTNEIEDHREGKTAKMPQGRAPTSRER